MRREYGDRHAADARAFLMDVALLPLNDSLLAGAASIAPDTLRSLNALHLVTALSIKDEVGVFATYDRRLAEAAVAHGLKVAQPRA